MQAKFLIKAGFYADNTSQQITNKEIMEKGTKIDYPEFNYWRNNHDFVQLQAQMTNETRTAFYLESDVNQDGNITTAELDARFKP